MSHAGVDRHTDAFLRLLMWLLKKSSTIPTDGLCTTLFLSFQPYLTVCISELRPGSEYFRPVVLGAGVSRDPSP